MPTYRFLIVSDRLQQVADRWWFLLFGPSWPENLPIGLTKFQCLLVEEDLHPRVFLNSLHIWQLNQRGPLFFPRCPQHCNEKPDIFDKDLKEALCNLGIIREQNLYSLKRKWFDWSGTQVWDFGPLKVLRPIIFCKIRNVSNGPNSYVQVVHIEFLLLKKFY